MTDDSSNPNSSTRSQRTARTIKAPTTPVLHVDDLHVSYGAISALSGISLKVPAGAIVTLIGGNGAGKTTTLHTLSGLVRAKSGSIRFLGEDITALAPHDIVARGLCHVPEGRMVFPGLTIDSLFPRLKERLHQSAGTLSGGEQQMLAIGRALMSAPKFLMLDEPSLGIAPRLISTIFEKIVAINRSGVAILLVEQNAKLALEISTHAYVLETGHIVMEGPSPSLRNDAQLKAAYLGS